MHVIDAASVIDAWGRLVRFHHSQDMASQLLLKEKVVSFKYTPTDMSPHVMEPERLELENNGANCAPSQDDVCATMLRSLPSFYESLVQAF